MQPYGIHWFRRDLRLAGNPALQTAWRLNEGRVLGFFCFDKAFLSRPDFSADRFGFFLETLVKLRDELRAAGGDLLAMDIGPAEAFAELFRRLERSRADVPATVTFNRDYEPYARRRDAAVSQWLGSQGVEVISERDHLLIEPHEIHKGDDPSQGYQVYTPFSKRWLELFATPEVQARVAAQARGLQHLEAWAAGKVEKVFSLTWRSLLGDATPEDVLDRYRDENRRKVTVPLPEAGSVAALRQLHAFEKRIDAYAETRDFPALEGTSRLSIFLKNGSLTIGQVIAGLGLKPYRKGDKSGRAKFLSELIWREFYYSILSRYPRVEGSAFQERFDGIRWENREDWFEAWKDGRTGYPIVDAAMRQLKTTGWMHNRLRMITASFLTKDLAVDWRWGEQWFMQKLLDGDLALNNGGWQWAASTGCDPQPYFRIFNPYLQSKKFDPDGAFIRRYVPELASLGSDEIHEPPASRRGRYPEPIVDHGERRDVALELYRVG